VRSFILLTVAKGVLPISVVFSLYLLLKGHNAPGGGFSAGLVMVGGVWLQALAFGIQKTKKRLARWVRPLLAGGLGLALLSVLLAPLVGGEPFTHFHWQMPGGWPLSSTLFFDIGVFLLVLGMGALIMARLQEVPE